MEKNKIFNIQVINDIIKKDEVIYWDAKEELLSNGIIMIKMCHELIPALYERNWTLESKTTRKVGKIIKEEKEISIKNAWENKIDDLNKKVPLFDSNLEFHDYDNKPYRILYKETGERYFIDMKYFNILNQRMLGRLDFNFKTGKSNFDACIILSGNEPMAIIMPLRIQDPGHIF